jgi:signal transduction histidine kinase
VTVTPGGPGVPYVQSVDEAAWGNARWRNGRRHRRGPAIGTAIVAGVFHVVGARDAAAHGMVYRPLDLLAYTILLIGPAVLSFRGRAPVVALAVATPASLAFSLVAAPRWMYVVATIVALFTTVKKGRGPAGFGIVAAGYLAYFLLTDVFGDRLGLNPGVHPGLKELLVLAGTLAVTMFLGSAAKAQSEHRVEAMKTRAERAKAVAEQERRQASEERLRMARELHDVLGHHLSLINVQAGVGLHLMDNQPEQAREALAAIKTASSEALREVRAVLGVLRPEEEVAPRQPPLGLDRLDELTGSAGLPVTTTTSGAPRPLPAEVDRAAYRIVQEALTNVRRHAPADAKAEVTVSYAPDSLILTIRNDGVAVVGPGEGSGIAGMRARAEALGGSIQAEPLDGGGFSVTARIPT